MRRILITGAGGFVGRNLAEYFNREDGQYKVFAARHSDLDLLNENAVRTFLSTKKIDLVLHCATCGGTRKTAYDSGSVDVVSRNLRMFFNLVRALPTSASMINMGSGAEYAREGYKHKIKEECFDKYVPSDSYGYSKYVISKYIANTKNITSLRIFGLYGMYEDYTFKFISNAIIKQMLGLPIVINRDVRFDYLWIGDFCRLVERFASIRPKFRHYNITPIKSINLVAIAGIINSAGQSATPVKVLNSGLNPEYTGSNKRLLNEIGDFDFTPYTVGIKQLYSYYLDHFTELDAETVRRDPYLKACR